MGQWLCYQTWLQYQARDLNLECFFSGVWHLEAKHFSGLGPAVGFWHSRWNWWNLVLVIHAVVPIIDPGNMAKKFGVRVSGAGLGNPGEFFRRSNPLSASQILTKNIKLNNYPWYFGV